MSNQNETIYENTPENAKKIGWIGLEEYWTGNPDAKFVTHNHVTGTFKFHN